MPMRVWSAALAIAVMLGGTIAAAGTVAAADPTPYSGTEQVASGKSFQAFVDDLEAAIAATGMAVVAKTCADCGARAIGETIPGNRVIMIFKPQFAVRMLRAYVPAGIEAPLRLYVTEQPDGTARLTYRLPSHVFGAYEVAELSAMGEELDRIVADIVADAVADTRR